MSTFNKHGELDGQDAELQEQLRQKQVAPIDIPEKQVIRPNPPGRGSSPRMFPPALIFAGVGLLLVLIIGGVLIGVAIGRSSAPAVVAVPTQPPAPTEELTVPGVGLADLTAVAEPTMPAEPTATREPAMPTSVSDSPTPEPGAALALSYTEGVEAYTAQRWAQAAERFQSVYQQDETYLDIAEKLSATFYNWGVELLAEPSPAEALDKFNAALSVVPTHELALAEQQRLVLYLDALSLRDRGALRDAAIKLEELRALQPDFLDSTALLYDIYIAYGGQLEEQGSDTDARRIYGKAANLPVADTSAATAGLVRLRPPPTTTPRPGAAAPAQSARLRFSLLNYNDDPRCISVRITGITPAGWFFSVDGLRIVGRFDGAGNARACGLNAGQEVTITVRDGNGTVVVGGSGVPSKGSAIMSAVWR